MFADIHTHLLYGTDDGPDTAEGMYEMVDRSYSEGTRILCATPHFHPEYFGDNRKLTEKAFDELSRYCAEKYPDLVLVLGNEMFYRHECISWLKGDVAKTYGSTRYVLLEFSEKHSENYIAEAVDRLLCSGYVPIIAHAERYPNLSIGRIMALRENGVLIQVNAQSFFARFFQLGFKRRMKAMLSKKVIDFVSSDAHDMTNRPPEMRKCYDYLASTYDEKYIEDIFYNNAKKLLCRGIDNE